MSRTTGSIGAAAGFLAAAALTACGGDVSGQPQPKAGGSLAGFDGCGALTTEQLQSLGVEPQGEPVNYAGAAGCRYFGRPAIVAITKDPDDGLVYYEQQASRFARYEENEVAGLPGAQIMTTGTGEECSQVVEVGGGSVNVLVTYDPEHQGDPCADALRIAEMIAPKLPR